MTMEQVTFRAPERQMDQVDALVERGEYPNRSEALRAAIRNLVDDADDRPGHTMWKGQGANGDD